MAKSNNTEDFTSDLIKSLNKEHGTRVAYNLAFSDAIVRSHIK